MYGNALEPGMTRRVKVQHAHVDGTATYHKVFTQKTINHVTAAVHCV